jgi:hypothetical protein
MRFVIYGGKIEDQEHLPGFAWRGISEWSRQQTSPQPAALLVSQVSASPRARPLAE